MSAEDREALQGKNVFERREKFDDWQIKHDINEYKGWKWQARIEHDLVKRTSFNQILPQIEDYIAGNESIDKLRNNKNAKINTESGWIPEGPFGSDAVNWLGRASSIAFHPTKAEVFYIGFGQGGIWKTTNAGQSFVPIGDQLPILRISGITIDPNNPETVYVCLGDMAYLGYDLYTADRKRATHYGLGIYKSTDGGNNWNASGLTFNLTEQSNSLIRKIIVNPKNSNEIIASGWSGIYRSIDAGKNWVKNYNKPISDIELSPSNPTLLLATGIYSRFILSGEANILKSNDFGINWQKITTDIPETKVVQRIEIDFSKVDPNYVYAVACDTETDSFYAFYQSTDAGQTWVKKSSKSMESRNILGDGYFGIGYDIKNDYGYGQGFYDLYVLADPENKNKVYVGGLTNFISNDGGNSWDEESVYGATTHPDEHNLAYNPLNKTFYLCNDGGVYETEKIEAKNKTSWKFTAKGINVTSFYRLSLSENGNDIMAGAQDNRTYFKAKNVWNNVYTGDGMECLNQPNNQNIVFAAYQYGVIAYSNYNPNEKLAFKNYFSPGRVGETAEWTTPYIYNKNDNAIIVAAGNLYKLPVDISKSITTEKLSSFGSLPNKSYPNQSTALAQCEAKPQFIYVAKMAHPLTKTPSTLLKTTTYGITWQDVSAGLPTESYISYLAVSKEDPNIVWATFSNFLDGKKVYESKNGGVSWQNISYNLPNLPANCVVHQEKGLDLIYIAMDIGIYYLPSGEKEWKLYSRNLPNVVVNELEINYAQGKIYAATFGRGIWSNNIVEELPGQMADANLVVFPNPVNNGKITVKAKIENQNSETKLMMLDAIGREVYSETIKSIELKYGYTINSQYLTNGLYYLVLENEGKRKNIKILKQ